MEPPGVLWAFLCFCIALAHGQKELNVDKLNALLQQVDQSWHGNTGKRAGENFQNIKICAKTYAKHSTACSMPMFGIMCFNYCAFKGHRLSFPCTDKGGVDWCHQSTNFETLLMQKARDKQQAKVIIRATLDNCYKTAVCDAKGDGLLDVNLRPETYKTTGPPQRTVNPWPADRLTPPGPPGGRNLPTKPPVVFPSNRVTFASPRPNAIGGGSGSGRTQAPTWPKWGKKITFFPPATQPTVPTTPPSTSTTPSTTTTSAPSAPLTVPEEPMKIRPRPKTSRPDGGEGGGYPYNTRRPTLPTVPPHWTPRRPFGTWRPPPVIGLPSEKPATIQRPKTGGGVDDEDEFETSWFAGKFTPGRWFNSIHLFTGKRR